MPRSVIKEIKKHIHLWNCDIVCLQELRGSLAGEEPQLEMLADTVWTNYSYGKNAIYPKGHHGNAVLSRYPIVEHFNVDISTNNLEKRGLLKTRIDIKNPAIPYLDVFCTHINLLEGSRLIQCHKILEEITQSTDKDSPIILCGDFNDWTLRCHQIFKDHGFHELHESLFGICAKTFPSFYPMVSLDRIYVKNINAVHAEVHKIPLSDHAALFAEIELQIK